MSSGVMSRMETFTPRLCLKAVDQYETILQSRLSKVLNY